MHTRKPFSGRRMIWLIVCFAASAVTAYALSDRLPADRLFCMPDDRTMVPCAAELALWLAASLTVCAMPLFAALTLYRGGCFGVTLALWTRGMLTAPDMFPLYAYAAVTMVMCLYAAGALPHPKTILRFLPCAGMACGIMMLV